MHEPRSPEDQRAYWESRHRQAQGEPGRNSPSEFAEGVLPLLSAGSKILELGCGSGADALFFARSGHRVVATDFSETAIASCLDAHPGLPGLAFQVVDIGRPLPFPAGQFDVVYARLSLHYFTDAATRAVFREIHRVLAVDGLLCFVCKTVDDPLYGQGEPIEKDMYRYRGHVRHFFTADYARECLAAGYSIELLSEHKADLYGKPSAFVEVVARRF